ncbi:MAG: glycosyltransferase family 2 protein [Acidimicrobiia bacterium]|nr:glycosyltransferase family 2 protein [Acidimicrobiia bacterium]
MNPAVSLVIPTRDRLPLLREAVGSVVDQTFAAWELIVVDDASCDGTSGWLERVGDERVRSIRLDDHVERSAARNRGLAAATGPTVLFLDDDDRLRPAGLQRLWTALNRAPGAVAAFGAKQIFDGSGHHKRIPHPRIRAVRPVWEEVMAGWFFVSGQVLLRTDAVRAVDGWDDDLVVAEDQDLWLRAIGQRPVVLVPDVVLEQRTRAEGVDADAQEEQVRARILPELPAADRSRAERLITARRHLRLAGTAFQDERFGHATAELVAAAKSAPSLLRSPIWGPQLVLSTTKATAAAALPGTAGARVRYAIRAIRTRLGRSPVEPLPPTRNEKGPGQGPRL